MHYSFFNTKIARCLAQHESSNISKIRNSLPVGFDAFDLFIDDVRIDSYYKFIDYICSKTPIKCKIQTPVGEVFYSIDSNRWIHSKNSDVTTSLQTLIDELNSLSEKALLLRLYENTAEI